MNTSRVARLALALLVGTAPLVAQENASPQTAAVGEASATDLLPGAAERVARMLVLSYGIVDVSDFKIDPTDGAFSANPDDTLWKATLKLRGSSLFLTPTDLAAAWGKVLQYRDSMNLAGLEEDPLRTINASTLVSYFERSRPRDLLEPIRVEFHGRRPGYPR